METGASTPYTPGRSLLPWQNRRGGTKFMHKFEKCGGKENIGLIYVGKLTFDDAKMH